MMADVRHTWPMRAIIVLLTAVLLVAVASVAPPAGAATTNCRVGFYAPGLEDATPRVANLRARNLPRRTDGYAPPCLVAETVAREVQTRASRSKRPARVRVFGARWNGGTWRCRYAGKSATCRKTGKPRRRVTLTLG